MELAPVEGQVYEESGLPRVAAHGGGGEVLAGDRIAPVEMATEGPYLLTPCLPVDLCTSALCLTVSETPAAAATALLTVS